MSRGFKCFPQADGRVAPEHIEELLREGWSPEQIVGRLRHLDEETACRQRIYELVRADCEAGGDLYLCLRRQGKKRNRKGASGGSPANLLVRP